MSENMRLVKVENINDVGVGERLEEDQIIVVVPARPRGNDGVRRSRSPDRRGQLRFHAVPAIPILHLGLVQDFEEYPFRIPRHIMLRHHAPEVGEAGDEVVFLQARLEIGIGVHIELDRQAGIENHLHRRVEIPEIFRRAALPLRRVHQGLRVHAQPHMVESQRLDERDVGRGIPALKVFFRISLGIVNLREPLTQVDAAAKVRKARRGDARARRSLRQRE